MFTLRARRVPLRGPVLALVLLGAAGVVTAPMPRIEVTAAPVAVETGPNASIEPEDLAGVAQVPADPAGVQERMAAQETAAARPLVSGYTQTSSTLHQLPVGRRPYDSTTVTPVGGFGLVDAEGVRMFRIPGSAKLWNHPVFQGAYALQNLNSYRLTGTQAYLDIAIKNAQRLVDRRVESDGAWYYPYDFNFSPLGDTSEMLRAPWYSGMAQGRVLSVFVRLFEATGDARWRTAADATFASMAQAPSGSLPYGSYVDTSRRLWLEEYPRYPASISENVLNGHIIALWGLTDYWQLTGSAQAASLAKGAIATVTATAMNGFRRVNGSSLYSLRHRTAANTYHQMHIEQFLQLWQYTHDIYFVHAANAYRNDYPYPATAGQMRATPRTSTIYQVDSALRITRSARVHFTRDTHAPTDRRQRLAGGLVALRVSKGPYTGWWFPESYGVTWLLGAEDTHGYAPEVRVRIAPGTYTAYRLNSAGVIAGSKTVTFAQASSAPSAVSGVVWARPSYYFTRGTYAGYWLAMVPGITVGAS
ncbi:D-glucuronyl C5-epimerase family protein [Actinophytocola sp. KF-1]